MSGLYQPLEVAAGLGQLLEFIDGLELEIDDWPDPDDRAYRLVVTMRRVALHMVDAADMFILDGGFAFTELEEEVG